MQEYFKRIMQSVKQDKTLEYRYTRNRDFTDEVASDYLQNQMLPKGRVQQIKCTQTKNVSIAIY